MRAERILQNVSYHVVYDESIMDALEYAHAHGFAGIQLAVEVPHLSFETVSETECDRIASFAAEHALSISLHAPDHAAPLFATSTHLLKGIFSYFEALFAFAERINARLVTCHPGPMPTFGTDTLPAESVPQTDWAHFRRTLDENLRRLIGLAAGRTIVCIENAGLDGTARQVLQPYLDAGELSLCWDLAKTYDGRRGLDADMEAYFWAHLDHVQQVHLHDRRDGRSHRVIGTGSVDFMRFLPRLAEANVLDYCIEVRPREKAAESFANLQQLLRSSAEGRHAAPPNDRS